MTRRLDKGILIQTPVADQRNPRVRQQILDLTNSMALQAIELKELTEPLATHLDVVSPRSSHVILVAGDLHFGSVETEHKLAMEWVNLWKQYPNILLLDTGDTGNGADPEKPTVGAANSLNPEQQLALIQSLYGPIHDRGQLLAMVGGMFSHLGWSAKHGGGNVIEQLGDKIRGNNPNQTPLINTGAQIKLRLGGYKEVLKIRVMHDPGSSSDLDPFKGLRNHKMIDAISLDPEDRSAVYIGAHRHIAAIGTDIDKREDNSGKPKTTHFIMGGTAQGVNPKRMGGAHGFLNERGVVKDGRHKSGTALIVANVGSRQHTIPSIGQGNFELQNSGLELLDMVVGASTREELLSSIPKKQIDPKLKFQREQSTPIKNTGKDPCRHPYFDRAVIKVDDPHPCLPIRVNLLNNLGLWSSSSDAERANLIVRKSAEARNTLLVLGNVISGQTASQFNRMEVLQGLTDLLKPVINTRSPHLLGVLVDEAMLHKNWGRDLTEKGNDGDRITHAAIVPTDFLYENITDGNSALLGNKATISLDFNGYNNITVRVFDKLAGRGSTESRARGLRKLMQLQGIRNDVLVGGNMPDAAIEQDWGTLAIAPGSLQIWEERGLGNRSVVAPCEQGFFIIPQNRHIFGFPTFEIGDDLFDGITLYQWHKHNGTLESLISRLKSKHVSRRKNK